LIKEFEARAKRNSTARYIVAKSEDELRRFPARQSVFLSLSTSPVILTVMALVTFEMIVQETIHPTIEGMIYPAKFVPLLLGCLKMIEFHKLRGVRFNLHCEPCR